MGKGPHFEQKHDNPYYLFDTLGELARVELECPGVYYVSLENQAGQEDSEYYIIDCETPLISSKAKMYGTPLANHPDILVVPLNVLRGGGDVIRYELWKYRVQKNMPLPEGESLHTAAIYGMEDYPEYFGTYPAPLVTSRGFTTRYKEIMSGVFAIETDTGEIMLAVCYPLWYDGFSSYTMQYAEQTKYDRETGIDNTLGYLFFPESAACLAAYELLAGNPSLLTCGMIDVSALQNAIWTHHPEYSVAFNRDEQAGLHDMIGLLANSLNCTNELSDSPESIIKITEGVGINWLIF